MKVQELVDMKEKMKLKYGGKANELVAVTTKLIARNNELERQLSAVPASLLVASAEARVHESKMLHCREMYEKKLDAEKSKTEVMKRYLNEMQTEYV